MLLYKNLRSGVSFDLCERQRYAPNVCGRYYNRRQEQEIAVRFNPVTVFYCPYAPKYKTAQTTFGDVVLKLDRQCQANAPSHDSS